MSDKQHLQKAVDELKKAETKRQEAVKRAADLVNNLRQAGAAQQTPTK